MCVVHIHICILLLKTASNKNDSGKANTVGYLMLWLCRNWEWTLGTNCFDIDPKRDRNI